MKTISLILIAFMAAATAQPPLPMSSQAGVMLRPNGSVMIDGWRAIGNTGGPGAMVDLPISVTFGATISDKAHVCVETDSGSSACRTLADIRTFVRTGK